MMKSIPAIRLLLGAASAIALAACATQPQTPTDPVEIAAPIDPVLLAEAPVGQLPIGVTPLAYTLDLVTDPALETFTGTVSIDVSLDKPHSRVWLHALEMDVISAAATTADGQTITASFTGDQAEGGVSRLDFETPLPTGVSTLLIEYAAPYNYGLAGLYKVTQADRPYLASQMEAIDARRMLPSFDEPRFKTPWTVSVTAPEGLEVITNGPRTDYENLGNGMLKHNFATTRPLQTYLLALAVGPYDSMPGADIPPSDLRADPVPLRGFSPYGKGAELEEALAATDELLLWQESYFDYPYPYGKLDLIAAPDFAYGAMENAGAIIYREAALLIDEKTSTSLLRRILTTHAHELGHQWFGNLVTPKWWDDIWLNEAFATWVSYKTMHDYDPNGAWERAATRAGLGAMSADSLLSARQIRNPITRNADISDAFDSITYRKGGHVLSMFEGYLGEDGFREGMRYHMKAYADGVADVEDFMDSLAKGSGKDDVVDSFRSFIFQPGIPTLDTQISCTADGDGRMDITQSRYAPLGSDIDTEASLWQIPFSARVNGPNGERVIRQMLTEKTTQISLGSDCPNWVMPNTDGVGYWRFTTDQDNWNALAAAQSDLTPGEQIVYADSLVAGFNAGKVSADALLHGLTAGTAGSWDAVTQPLGAYRQLEAMLTADARSDMKDWVQTTYIDLYTSLERDDVTIGESLLRTDLEATLIKHGQMPDMRADLAARANLYLGVNGDPQPDAISADELSTALAVGAELGDQAYYDAALAYALATTDQREKRMVINSLAANGNARMVADIMKRVQGNGFSGNDAYGVMFNAMTNNAERDTAWSIFKASFDNITAKLPELRKPQMPKVTGAFCSLEDAADAEAFFNSKADIIPGYERSLAQGLEQAKLCAALRAAKSEELATALGSL
jgi:alanyl aminopeptidase